MLCTDILYTSKYPLFVSTIDFFLDETKLHCPQYLSPDTIRTMLYDVAVYLNMGSNDVLRKRIPRCD